MEGKEKVLIMAKKTGKSVKKQQKKNASQTKKAEDIKKPVANIEFCDKCSSIMIPEKKGGRTYLKCRKCGATKKREVKTLKIMEAKKQKKDVTILEKDTTPLPMVEQKCEKCNNNHAYFWLQQTRAADEPPTQFFRCTKCNYTWREYK